MTFQCAKKSAHTCWNIFHWKNGYLAKINVVSFPKGKVHFYVLEIFTGRLGKKPHQHFWWITFRLENEMMMFSTANFSKIMPCFLFFHQHYMQERVPVYDQFYQSLYTPAYSHTSAPRTAVPLPHLRRYYPLQALPCPQQHRSPALAAASSRECTDAHDGEKQDLKNTYKMASKNHAASATLWVFRLGWHLSSSGASPKLYQPESLQGRAGGTCWNGSRGLEAPLLVGRGTPFPSHNSPGLL